MIMNAQCLEIIFEGKSQNDYYSKASRYTASSSTDLAGACLNWVQKHLR